MTNNDTAVLTTLDRVYAAWADNDADAFVANYVPDATATLPGVHLPDRDAIRDAMVAAFAGPLKGTRATYDVRRIRFPHDDMAIVSSQGAVVPAGADEPDENSRSLGTFVLARTGGNWLVTAFHNCPAQ